MSPNTLIGFLWSWSRLCWDVVVCRLPLVLVLPLLSCGCAIGSKFCIFWKRSEMLVVCRLPLVLVLHLLSCGCAMGSKFCIFWNRSNVCNIFYFFQTCLPFFTWFNVQLCSFFLNVQPSQLFDIILTFLSCEFLDGFNSFMWGVVSRQSLSLYRRKWDISAVRRMG